MLLEATSLRKKSAALFVTLVMACVMALGLSSTAFALPGTVSANAFSTYKIETVCNSTDDSDQHVKIILKNVDVLSPTDAENSINGTDDASPTCTITIAGRNITSTDYHRVADVYQSGSDAVIDLGPVGDFTAQYNGAITVSGTIDGLENADGSDVSPSINTIIPTGFKLNVLGEGTNQLTISVAEFAHVRGMIHLGIYEGDTLAPICPTVGNVGSNTFTIHAHQFATMQAPDYLNAIANLSMPSGYSVSYIQGATTLTITGPSDAELYMGVFDDDLLQSMGTTWGGVSSNEGELNPDGTPKE